MIIIFLIYTLNKFKLIFNFIMIYSIIIQEFSLINLINYHLTNLPCHLLFIVIICYCYYFMLNHLQQFYTNNL